MSPERWHSMSGLGMPVCSSDELEEVSGAYLLGCCPCDVASDKFQTRFKLVLFDDLQSLTWTELPATFQHSDSASLQ